MIISPSNRLGAVQEYYFSKKLREVRDLIDMGKPILNLAIGNPDQPPASKVIDKLTETSQIDSNHGYQPYKGIPELRLGMSSWMSKTYGIDLDSDTEILPLIGSKEAIMHISLAFLDEGDQVLIPDLAYPAYASAAKMMKAEVIRFPLNESNNWSPDWDFLEKLDTYKVKLLWINYPHMPTGQAGSHKLLQKFIDWAFRKKVLICHDNPYSLILNPKPTSILSVDKAKGVALELNSMSKSHNMPGWRIGWLSGAKEYLDTVLRVKSNFDSGQFKPVQLAAAEGLRLPRNWYKRNNSVYKERESIVLEFLQHMGCSQFENQVGMFKWAKIPHEFSDSQTFTEFLLIQKDIFITPGFIFGDKGKDYIRISLCSPVSDYEEAIRRWQN